MNGVDKLYERKSMILREYNTRGYPCTYLELNLHYRVKTNRFFSGMNTAVVVFGTPCGQRSFGERMEKISAPNAPGYYPIMLTEFHVHIPRVVPAVEGGQISHQFLSSSIAYDKNRIHGTRSAIRSARHLRRVERESKKPRARLR